MMVPSYDPECIAFALINEFLMFTHYIWYNLTGFFYFKPHCLIRTRAAISQLGHFYTTQCTRLVSLSFGDNFRFRQTQIRVFVTRLKTFRFFLDPCRPRRTVEHNNIGLSDARRRMVGRSTIRFPAPDRRCDYISRTKHDFVPRRNGLIKNKTKKLPDDL